jgi:hypothetical protein
MCHLSTDLLRPSAPHIYTIILREIADKVALLLAVETGGTSAITSLGWGPLLGTFFDELTLYPTIET